MSSDDEKPKANFLDAAKEVVNLAFKVGTAKQNGKVAKVEGKPLYCAHDEFLQDGIVYFVVLWRQGIPSKTVLWSVELKKALRNLAAQGEGHTLEDGGVIWMFEILKNLPAPQEPGMENAGEILLRDGDLDD